MRTLTGLGEGRDIDEGVLGGGPEGSVLGCKGQKVQSWGNPADWVPQVLPWVCVSATPRSVARDAAYPGPVATPVPATLVSGLVPRVPAASVSWAEGVSGAGVGRSA
jgi:hypothetical protein